jgi:hypothetical protein
MKKLLFLLLFPIVASSQCITVNSAFFTNPSNDGVHWSLNLNWTAQGVNHLKIYVKENTDTVLNTCFQMSNNTQTTGTSVYDGIFAPGGLPTLSATFCRWTGSCGSGVQCAPNQVIDPGGVLDITFDNISAKYINGNTAEVRFRILSTSSSKTLYLNLRMKDGKIKKCKVDFPNYVKPGEYWKVLLNYQTGNYIITKL